jgi:monofunctional chorismate mutase
MQDINDMREEIDAIDRKLIALFLERMDVSRRIALYKSSRGMAVLDSSREEQLLARAREQAPEALKKFAAEEMRSIMELSRLYQQEIINKTSP